MEALCRKGRQVSIEQKCFYSIRYARVMTKYIIRERDAATNRNPKVFETYSAVELVMRLAEMYKEVTKKG